MRHSLNMSAVALVLVAVLAFPAMSLAAKGKAQAAKESADREPAVEAEAARILEKGCKALAGLKGFSFLANVTLDKVYADGSKIQTDRSMTVRVERPGSFRVVTDGDDYQAVSVFDGKLFTLSLPDRKVYGQIEAPMDTDGLMSMLASRYGLESPLGDLLSNSPCDKLRPVAGYYVGKSKVDGTVCDHLFFQGKDVDWQLWIEDSPESLPRKLVITEKKLPEAPQFTAVLRAWRTDEAGPEAFAFDPPAGFTRDDGVITGRKPAKK